MPIEDSAEGIPPVKLSLSNVEIVTIAIYLVGGDSRRIDTEDAAIKAAQIVPGRFTWKKYRDQVNLELIRVYLSDAKKSTHGAYIIGSGNAGWSLTPAGLSFARSASGRLVSQSAVTSRVQSQDAKWLKAERARLLSTDGFKKFVTGKKESITMDDASAFFRLDDYVRGTLRQQKITRLLGAFGESSELGGAANFLAEMLARASVVSEHG